MKTEICQPTRRNLARAWNLALAVGAGVLLLSAGCRKPCRPGGCLTAPAPAAPAAPAALEEDLFDGRTLEGWKAADFAGSGELEVKNGELILNEGVMTGVNYTNELPKMDYEVSWDAKRISGSDFFCSLTFPVADSFCTLIVGGWGGGVVGISSVDSMDASENETTKFINFENNKWYHFRIRVTKTLLEAWIDTDKVVDLKTKGRALSLRPGEIESSKPFGFATWASGGALKNIKLKKLKPEE